MSWKPTIQELETVWELSNAGLSPDRIAGQLSVDLGVFLSWASRCANAPELPFVDDDIEPIESPRITAERMFKHE